jgi:hypothetical protein
MRAPSGSKSAVRPTRHPDTHYEHGLIDLDCGNALFTGGVIANELDCNTPCAGNGTQPCGGGSRLTLYLTTEVTGPGVNPGVDGWESMGCYRYAKPSSVPSTTTPTDPAS